MGIFEIISAIVLIIACVFIVIVVLMQDTKTQMSQTISGSTADNYFGKNSGRTKEAMLNKAMTTAAIIFFVLAILVNVVNVYFGGSKEDTTSSTPSTSLSVAGTVEAATDEASGTAQAASTVQADATSQAESETESQAEGDSESQAGEDTPVPESTASTAEQ